MMDNKNKKSLPISSMLNLIAGILFVLAAFHILTSDVGIDYRYIFIGIVFLVLGIMGIINHK